MNDSYCFYGYCDPRFGCVTAPVDCDAALSGTLGDCHTIDCSEVPRIGRTVVNGQVIENAELEPGCFTKLIDAVNTSACSTNSDGEYICPDDARLSEDECGVCGGDGSTCGLSIAEIAGITAGAIAGIAIGAIAGAAIVGAGAKKGYDVWAKNRANLNTAAISPIYHDSGRTGVNPLHESKPAS